MTPALAVLAVAAVVVAGWYVDVRWHPVRRCPSCGGSKKNWGSDTRRWGTCRRCGGRGDVRRFGAGRES